MKLIIGIVFIIIILYLIGTNKPKLKNKNYKENRLLFTLRAILKGFFLYSIIGYLIAHFIILNKGEVHSHSMIGLLYLWLSISGAITGIILGLIFALLKKRNINKNLFIGSFFFIIIILLWWNDVLNLYN